MKHKLLAIIALLFFVAVNTGYYWSSYLGGYAWLVLWVLMMASGILLVTLVVQGILAYKENFRNKERLATTALLGIVLLMTAIRPGGWINWSRLEGPDLLVAEREGAANCHTIFKLKKNNRFTERSVCFGVTETKGAYARRGDTLFFHHVTTGNTDSPYYRFAVIKAAAKPDSQYKGELVRYRDATDTTGHVLWISRNTLGQ